MAAHARVDAVVQRARGRRHPRPRRWLGGRRGGIEIGVEGDAEQAQLTLQHLAQRAAAHRRAQLVRGPEPHLIDLVGMGGKRTRAVHPIGPQVLGLHRGARHVLVHRLEVGAGDRDPEFLPGLTYGGGGVVFPDLQVAADRGVPLAGLNRLVGRPLLQQPAALMVEDQDVNGAVLECRVAVRLCSRDRADDPIDVVDPVQQLVVHTRSHASAGIQWLSWFFHLTLHPIGLVSGTGTSRPASSASIASRSSCVVARSASRVWSSRRPV